MKKILLLMLGAGVLSANTNTANAQEDKTNDSKREIVIQNNDNKDFKITVEIKNDDILINGKPLAEFKGNGITITKRKESLRRGNNFSPIPRGGKSFYFNDDDDETTRPFLGVTTKEADNGVKITNVVKGSAAEKSGLKEDDIIAKIGNKKITDPDNLMEVIKSYKPKDEVTISYQRNGKFTDAKAVLGEKKERSVRSFSFNGNGDTGDLMKNFNFDMPAMPDQSFPNFWMARNKKLGVKVEDTENDTGAKITGIEEGSSAEKAGLRKDDIITEVDGKKVKNTSEVREQVLENEKASYTVKAKRGASDMSFEIKIPKKINSANL